MGELEIDIPQDRNSSFNPKIVPKYKHDISAIEQMIINMYARGQTTREISKQIEDIYGFEALAELVSKITDKIQPEIEEWQNRRLSEVYPIVYIVAIVFSVRKDKVVQKSAVYVALGMNSDGKKDVLSIEVAEMKALNSGFKTVASKIYLSYVLTACLGKKRGCIRGFSND